MCQAERLHKAISTSPSAASNFKAKSHSLYASGGYAKTPQAHTPQAHAGTSVSVDECYAYCLEGCKLLLSAGGAAATPCLVCHRCLPLRTSQH